MRHLEDSKIHCKIIVESMKQKWERTNLHELRNVRYFSLEWFQMYDRWEIIDTCLIDSWTFIYDKHAFAC